MFTAPYKQQVTPMTILWQVSPHNVTLSRLWDTLDVLKFGRRIDSTYVLVQISKGKGKGQGLINVCSLSGLLII